MQSVPSKASVVLHQVPLMPLPQAKSVILRALQPLALTDEDILLVKKEGKLQAFLSVPVSQLQAVCDRKQIVINNERVFVRKWFDGFQVFIGSVPDSMPGNFVKQWIEKEFGAVVRIEEVLPHEGSKSYLKHLYLQFQRDADAQNCLFSKKKLNIGEAQLRVARAYAFGENEDTDKRLFLKVTASPSEDPQNIENAMNDYFRQKGRLREKVRLQNGRGVVVFTSQESCEQTYKSFKEGRIGKYQVQLRPYIKESYTVFMAGVNSNLTADQIRECLADYQPIFSCQIMVSSSPNSSNAVVTFSSQESFKRILVEYKGNQLLKKAFVGQPYVTIHMSAKDRNDYKSFKKGNRDKRSMILGQRPPLGFGMQQQFFPMGMMIPPPQFSMGPPPGFQGMGGVPIGQPRK